MNQENVEQKANEVDKELIDKFYSVFGDDLKQLVEERWEDIVRSIPSLDGEKCLYKLYLQKTSTDNFSKSIDIISHKVSEDFHNDFDADAFAKLAPKPSTITWINEKIKDTDQENKKKQFGQVKHTLEIAIA